MNKKQKVLHHSNLSIEIKCLGLECDRSASIFDLSKGAFSAWKQKWLKSNEKSENTIQWFIIRIEISCFASDKQISSRCLFTIVVFLTPTINFVWFTTCVCVCVIQFIPKIILTMAYLTQAAQRFNVIIVFASCWWPHIKIWCHLRGICDWIYSLQCYNKHSRSWLVRHVINCMIYSILNVFK